MRTLLALGIGLLAVASATAQPANDACGSATPIAALPFTASVDTTAATDDPADPFPSCSFGGLNTVWFTYTPSKGTTLLLDTNGSDYTTSISVFIGGCATPTEIACQHDDDFDGTTELIVPVAAGQTVLIFVDGDSGGGNLVFHAAKSSIDATPPTSLRAIVTAGDPAPTGAGFASITRGVMLSRTDVAFTASTGGIFVNVGGTTSTAAISGDPSPVGGVYAGLGRPARAANGTTAFVAGIRGGTATQGLFLHSGGITTPLVVQGDAAPDGGTFVNFVRGIAISPNGTLVAFAADTTLSGRERLYVASTGGGVVGPLLSELTDPSPCGDDVRQIGAATPTFAIADDGEIGIWIRGTDFDAVLHYFGFWAAIACEGSATPIGGTYRALSRNLRMNNQIGAQIAFHSTITLPGPDTEAVFRASPIGVFVVAQDNQLTTGGQTITDFPSNAVTDIDDTGTTVFFARTSAGNAIVRVPQGGLPTAGPIVGDPCGAGTLTAIDTLVDSDGAGNLAFRAACGGVLGIFRIPAGGGPLVQVAALDDVTTAGPGFFFDDPSIQGSDVSFSGTRAGIYRIHCSATACDPPTTIAQPLTAIPGLPGEEIATVYTEVLAGQGNLVGFQVTTRGGPFRRDALLASRAGVLELVTAGGLIIPGTTAEVTDVFGNGLAAVASPLATDKRGIAFTVEFTDPNDLSASSGVYLTRSGVTTEIARDGQPSPDGGLYDQFATPLVKGTRVYFRATTNLADCFVRATGSVHTGLGCSGDTLEEPVGATLQTIETDVPGLASRGPVFHASLGGSFFGECLLTATTSGPTPVACSGDPLPYGGAIDTSSGFDTLVIGASRKRVISLVNDENFLTGLFEFSPRAIARIAANDQPTPIGGVYSLFDPRPSIVSKAVVFVSDVIGGTSPNALFLATLKR
jgi:hypothetical protein